MEFTGERVIPGKTDPDLLNEHVARYRFAEALVSGRRALDAGCGAGYGSAILARAAARVYALDNSGEALSLARAEHAADNIRYVRGDCSRLPLLDASLDAVVAFEVIEHLENWSGLLAEARRVLRPDGRLIVSTPNRPFYEKTRTVPNPFHVHEFDYEEFREELQKVFPHVTIFLENHAHAIAFTPLVRQGLRTIVEETEPRPEEAHFFLAVCSEQSLYGSPAFVYVPETGNVLGEREKHIAKLEGELATKSEWLAKSTAELDALAKTNQEEHDRAQAAVAKLEAEIEDKNRWAEQADAAVEDADRNLKRMEAALAERTEWTQSVEAEQKRMLVNYAALEAESEDRLKQLKDSIAKIDELEARVIERTEWANRLNEELESMTATKVFRLARKLGFTKRNDP